jgi:hypothetical protein
VLESQSWDAIHARDDRSADERTIAYEVLKRDDENKKKKRNRTGAQAVRGFYSSTYRQHQKIKDGLPGK